MRDGGARARRRRAESQLRVRIGLNTGEAATGSRARRRLVHDRRRGQRRRAARAGRARRRDPARRSDTYRLVAHAVEAERGRAPDGQGQARRDRRLPAARRSPPTAPARPQRAGAPMVDREDEWRAHAWPPSSARAAARACELCTVVGSPGVGKSRLVAELAEHVRRPRDGRQRPLPALRRDAHVVAAGGGAGRAGCSAGSTATSTRRSRARPSCWTRRATRSRPTRRSGRCASCSSGSRGGGRSCSPSTTSSGPTRRSWTCSTT